MRAKGNKRNSENQSAGATSGQVNEKKGRRGYTNETLNRID